MATGPTRSGCWPPGSLLRRRIRRIRRRVRAGRARDRLRRNRPVSCRGYVGLGQPAGFRVRAAGHRAGRCQPRRQRRRGHPVDRRVPGRCVPLPGCRDDRFCPAHPDQPIPPYHRFTAALSAPSSPAGVKYRVSECRVLGSAKPIACDARKGDLEVLKILDCLAWSPGWRGLWRGFLFCRAGFLY